jgi:3-deoxy-7-phosphoheptulonate synthase
VIAEIPRSLTATRTVTRLPQRHPLPSCKADDDRLLVVIGPCSIHDPAAAMDYASSRLRRCATRSPTRLEIVMRVYFEKPRTTVGWKGLINDPDLDGSFDIDKGLRLARKLLLDGQQSRPAGRRASSST